MDTQGKFYLGRVFDPENAVTTDRPFLYDPADLTTHAMVVGMTGSGKTGLCVDLLEEAALQGIPALMIDPKGDIANLLLHFPNLDAQDFQPWISPDQARRAGKTIEQAAQEIAATWRDGLSQWGIPPERLRALAEAVEFALYTPGSDAGIPVNILASFKAPAISWEGNRELLREKISATVTALLALVGMTDIDPVRSREHILLANLFEHAWSRGIDLDLGELILQTQSPPFEKLGVFDVNTFFPEKDRSTLAMLLNNILATPSFQSWIEGQPLDIPNLLYTPEGRPRHSVFYIAHLTDAERMFFVTLLFSAVESWMRAQTGIASLRAMIYFDEIFGYLPPVKNPPSKLPMLRMLKQGRAFGVGLVLVTQNPTDLDYKALSNAGTWFIGKLQTEQDKQHLLDGLQSALSGGLDRGEYDRLLSTLGKRVFLMHNIHQAPSQLEASGGFLFQTRWAMNYLAGPLSRAQIPALMQLSAGREESPLVAQPQPRGDLYFDEMELQPPLSEGQPIPVIQPSVTQIQLSTTRPAVPAGVTEYFLPNNLTFTQAFQAAGRPYPDQAFSQGLFYRPVLLAQAGVRFLNRRLNLDYEYQRAAQVERLEQKGATRWDQFKSPPVDPTTLDSEPVPGARFESLEAAFLQTRLMAALEKDFLDWVYREAQVTVRANETLKVYAGPDVSQAEFRTLCAEAARGARDGEVKEVSADWERKISALESKLEREVRELREDETEHQQRKMEEMGTHAENVLSIFSRRRSRRLSTSLTKRRLTQQSKAEVEESEDVIADLRKQIAVLEQERTAALEEINDRWGQVANQETEIPVIPLKKDVFLDLFGVAWAPYYQVKIGAEIVELPGYTA